MRRWTSTLAVVLVLAPAATAAAQTPAPTTTPVPAATTPGAASVPVPESTPVPLLDLRMLRFKISAGDLPSAESILETHRAEKGDDAETLLCLAWLARGAALLGDWPAATHWSKEARAVATARLGTPPVFEGNSEAQYTLGTAIEVDAQALAAAGRKAEAIRVLDESARSLEKAPYNLRARIQKRRNQLVLVGSAAPEFRVEESTGAPFVSLEALRGRPVVMFFWWESCGDCRAEAPAVKRIVERYAGRVAFVAPTRVYGEDRAAGKAEIEKTWKETYGMPAAVAVPISDEAMRRYGVSATPTFAFVDRKGIVRQYLPYRMTEERLAAAIDELLK